MGLEIQQAFLESLAEEFPENDSRYLNRLYMEGLEHYQERLEALGFLKGQKVLDAGCGFGQWSFSWASHVIELDGVDMRPERIDLCRKIATEYGFSNTNFSCSSLSEMAFASDAFDKIFSYSVFQYLVGTYQKALRECYRILKPGGRFYFTANLFWRHLNRILKNPHASSEYSPRRLSLQTIFSQFFWITGKKNFREQFFILMKLKKELTASGFKIMAEGPEGTIHMDPQTVNKPNYKLFFGIPQVWEFLCEK